MKFIFAILAVVLIACNDNQGDNNKEKPKDSINAKTEPSKKVEVEKKSTSDRSPEKVYSNARFKDVTVNKTGINQYTVKGKGQIFEANFSWVVEDGHEELKKGHQMTDAGAPEWGKFSFTIDIPKKKENSTRTLILFEISAKDGSRQHELPIPLPDK
jgi:hypothetical protein